MRLPHHLVRSATGIFHFRMRVPRDAQPDIGCAILKRSLHTRDPQVARAYAYVLSARYAQAFAAHKDVAAMPKPSLLDIQAALARGDINRYEFDVDPATRSVTRLRTDGSAQDHLRALEAMRLVFAQPLPPKMPAQPVAPAKKGWDLTLDKAVSLYEQAEVPGLKPNTWSQRQRALASFVGAVGATTPVADIERSRASEWAQN